MQIQQQLASTSSASATVTTAASDNSAPASSESQSPSNSSSSSTLTSAASGSHRGSAAVGELLPLPGDGAHPPDATAMFEDWLLAQAAGKSAPHCQTLVAGKRLTFACRCFRRNCFFANTETIQTHFPRFVSLIPLIEARRQAVKRLQETVRRSNPVGIIREQRDDCPPATSATSATNATPIATEARSPDTNVVALQSLSGDIRNRRAIAALLAASVRDTTPELVYC